MKLAANLSVVVWHINEVTLGRVTIFGWAIHFGITTSMR